MVRWRGGSDDERVTPGRRLAHLAASDLYVSCPHGLDVTQVVFGDAAAAVDPALADRIYTSRRWRSDYISAVGELTQRAVRSRSDTLDVARAGLQSLARHVERHGSRRPDESSALLTDDVCSRGDLTPATELVVPYRGGQLAGAALLAQLHRWVLGGVVEPSFAVAIERVVAHPEWLSLPGRHVAIIGAQDLLAPTEVLASWGADLLLPEVPGLGEGPSAVRTAVHAGQINVPVRSRGRYGLDPLTDNQVMTTWLAEHARRKPLVLGAYSSSGGIVATAAIDAMIDNLVGVHPDITLAGVGSPLDFFALDPSDLSAPTQPSESHWGSAARRLLRSYPEPADTISLAGGLLSWQGPAHALVRRITRWRSLDTARRGRRVSFNVAPVVTVDARRGGKLSRRSARGVTHFGVEFFAPDTARTLMAALLVHDVNQPIAPASMQPERLLTDQAAHSGLWRCGLAARSLLPAAVLLGVLPRRRA